VSSGNRIAVATRCNSGLRYAPRRCLAQRSGNASPAGRRRQLRHHFPTVLQLL